MELWKRFRRLTRIGADNRLTEDKLAEDKLTLFNEIEKAKMDWINAQKKFNDVLEKEQIDYAIYALEAAEKRYEMLLKQAKKMQIHALEIAVSCGGKTG